MAIDFKKRRDEEEEDEEQKDEQGFSPDYITKLNELLERAEPLIMSVNSSYNQFAAGVEVRPPLERRVQLDQMMNTLMLMAKPTPAYRFRYQSLQSTYSSYKQRWDRMMTDIESGKIKRFAKPGPKR